MKKISLMLVVAALFLSGCQQAIQDAETSGSSQELPMPYSKGPTNPPTDMKGPSGPPPTSASDDSTKAATEKENIRLTLPKAEVETEKEN